MGDKTRAGDHLRSQGPAHDVNVLHGEWCEVPWDEGVLCFFKTILLHVIGVCQSRVKASISHRDTPAKQAWLWFRRGGGLRVRRPCCGLMLQRLRLRLSRQLPACVLPWRRPLFHPAAKSRRKLRKGFSSLQTWLPTGSWWSGPRYTPKLSPRPSYFRVLPRVSVPRPTVKCL